MPKRPTGVRPASRRHRLSDLACAIVAVLDRLEPRFLLSSSAPNTALSNDTSLAGIAAHIPVQSESLIATPAVTLGNWFGFSSCDCAYGGDPVRLSDGTYQEDTTDLEADGFGSPWGVTRSWTNNPLYRSNSIYDKNQSIGNNWDNSQEPQIFADASGDVYAVLDGTTSNYFLNYGSGSYSSQSFVLSTLTLNGSSYVLTDESGNQTEFFGFSSSVPSYKQGLFQSYHPAGGQTINAAYNDSGQLTSETRSEVVGSATDTESFVYNYNGGSGMVDSITLERWVNTGSPTVIRKVAYAYYNGTESFGLLHDLKTAEVENASGQMLSEDYYRYYSSGNDDLEYEVEGADFNKLNASSGGSPLTASQTEVQTYASIFLSYDSNGGTALFPNFTTQMFDRVTSETVSGYGATEDGQNGQGTYNFNYSSSPPSGIGYNSISYETTVTRPSGLNSTVYTNMSGEPVLTIDYDASSSQTRITYDEYDASGFLELEAQPSAVEGVDAGWISGGGGSTYPDLYTNAGEIDIYQHYRAGDVGTGNPDVYAGDTAAASSPGAAPGFLADEQVEEGSQGTPVVLSSYDYFTRTAVSGGPTIYVLANETDYPNNTSSGAETTSYSYPEWFSGTFQPQEMVTTLPVVSATQNGSGATTTDTQIFDMDRNTVWEKDPDGDISFTAIDAVTGGILETISDVNTSTSDNVALSTLDVTSPFTLYAGDGLSVINNFDLDPEGRVTGEQDGDGNWTYIVYDDVNHETLMYPGWHSTASGYYTTTGPVQVEHDNWASGYVDTFDYAYQPSSAGQMTTTGGLIVPTGNDSNGAVTSLTREEQDNGGQTTLSLDYVNLSGVTFNASNATLFLDMDTNYDTTSYAYDGGGNLDRVQSADGTIDRTVYDQFDEPVSTWIGAVEGTTPDDSYPSVWSPSSTSGMVEVSAMSYDADGNETEMVQYPNGTGSNGSASLMYYDFRDRLVEEVDGAVDTGTSGEAVGDPTDNATSLTAFTLDNLGEVVETKSFAWNTASTDTFSTSTAPIIADFLQTADSTSKYDSQGDVYETTVESISPTTFAADGPTETTNDYYDADQNLIAELEPNGEALKYVYNGAGWNTLSYVTDGGQLNNASNLTAGSTNAYLAASTVTNDVVLSQQQNIFDNAGNTIETISADRFGTDPTAGSSAVGPLGTPTTGVEARLSYTDSFFDSGERDVADVNVGTYNGSSYPFPSTDTASAATAVSSSVVNLSTGSSIPSRTYTGYQLLILAGTGSGERATVTGYSSGIFTLSVNAAGWGVLPNSSSTFALIDPGSQVSQTSYTPAGYVSQTIDPRGIATGFNYDALGETLTEVDDDTAWGLLNLSASVPTDSSNQTTAYTYDGDGNELTMTAVMPAGETSQVTHYIYGVNTGTGTFGGSLIDDNDLLAQVQYSDPTTGSNYSSGSTAYNQSESYTYNVVAQPITYTDRNLTTHDYTYDPGFRLTSDSVSFGPGDPADTGVTELAYAYNPAGLMSTATSLNASGVVNQVGMTYNGFGDLIGSAQAHVGFVGDDTPTVGYTFDAAHGDRPSGIVYPDGRAVSYDYATGLFTAISQLSGISDADGPIQSYSDYLGLGMPGVTTDGNGVTLSYMNTAAGSSALNLSNGGGGDKYSGLDRFDRVIDHNWGTQASSTSAFVSVDRVQTGYDADGNVTWQNNLVQSNQNETFTNDNLNRLTSYNRGSISVSNDAATPTSNIASGSWTLNAVGGWNASSVNSSSTSRTNNAQNQIVADGTATLGYDADGNTTADENGDTDIYDAWNRLVAVNNSSGQTIAAYGYDADGERITENHNGIQTDLYYSDQWQVLEEDNPVSVAIGDGYVPTASVAAPAYQFVWSPFDVDKLVERDTLQVTGGTPNFGSVTQSAANSDTVSDGGVTSFADGTTVVGATDQSTGDIILLAYNSDGSADGRFGVHGELDTSISGNVAAVAFYGTTVYVAFDNSSDSLNVAAFNESNGTLLTSFGTDGVASANFGDAVETLLLAVDSSGRPVVAGMDGSGIEVARFNAGSGSPDGSFGTSGEANAGDGGGELDAIAIGPSDQIALGGINDDGDAHVVVLTSGGVYDDDFNDNTSNTLCGGSGSAYGGGVTALGYQSDGKLLAVISDTSLSDGEPQVVRLTAAGAFDSSFGTGGVSTEGDSAYGYSYFIASHIAVDSSGDITLLGICNGEFIEAIGLTSGGSLNDSFGYDGAETGGSIGVDTASTVASAGTLLGLSASTGTGLALATYNPIGFVAVPADRLYAETDANDDVTSISDSTGAVVERYQFDPYGNVTVLNPDGSTRGDGTAMSSDYGWVYLHQGLRLDVVLGVYDNRNRIYDPATGRFWQEDPTGAAYVNGPNSYQIQLGDPLGGQDPEGLAFIPAGPHDSLGGPSPVGSTYQITNYELFGDQGGGWYTGSTANMPARFAGQNHEYGDLVKNPGSTIEIRPVYGNPSAANSGQGTYRSAMNETLRSQEYCHNEEARERFSETDDMYELNGGESGGDIATDSLLERAETYHNPWSGPGQLIESGPGALDRMRDLQTLQDAGLNQSVTIDTSYVVPERYDIAPSDLTSGYSTYTSPPETDIDFIRTQSLIEYGNTPSVPTDNYFMSHINEIAVGDGLPLNAAGEADEAMEGLEIALEVVEVAR